MIAISRQVVEFYFQFRDSLGLKSGDGLSHYEYLQMCEAYAERKRKKG